jgi:hypothetical protein
MKATLTTYVQIYARHLYFFSQYDVLTTFFVYYVGTFHFFDFLKSYNPIPRRDSISGPIVAAVSTVAWQAKTMSLENATRAFHLLSFFYVRIKI